MNLVTPENLVADARVAFDCYLAATNTFCRTKLLADGNFMYPKDTIQADVAAFAGSFIYVWRAIENCPTFDQYYAAKPLAFKELARIVTPNDQDAQGFTSHARFWKYATPTPVTDRDGMRSLCRTLRNGLAHFNFRYVDVAPSEYFPRMGLTLPPYVLQPDIAGHYRIFICDWKKSKTFMDPKSDTRIIETHFAHFRYHLFMFLARLFSAPGHELYEDILTRQPIT
jgi:hypothetical protein